MSKHKRETASSGNVDYSEAVVLHETTKSKIEIVPFYFPNTDRFAVKLIRYRKGSATDPGRVEEEAISLNEGASKKLMATLKEFSAVAQQGDTGNFLVVKVGEHISTISGDEESEVATMLAEVLSQPDIAVHLAQTEMSSELVSALRTAIRVNEMENAVAQLRQHLEGGDNEEQVYQDWCNEHSWAFGNAYVVRDKVRGISPSDNLDLLLPNVFAGYRDIVELKRPDRKVLNYDAQHRNHYFTADVSSAIGQCHRYLDVLHEVAAKGLRDHPEVVAYHPRAIIVIGRSGSWSDDECRSLHGLNRRLSGITVMTYDQLLAQGERIIQMVAQSETSDDIDDCTPF